MYIVIVKVEKGSQEMQEVVGGGVSNGGTTGKTGWDRTVNIVILRVFLSTQTGCPSLAPNYKPAHCPYSHIKHQTSIKPEKLNISLFEG